MTTRFLEQHHPAGRQYERGLRRICVLGALFSVLPNPGCLDRAAGDGAVGTTSAHAHTTTDSGSGQTSDTNTAQTGAADTLSDDTTSGSSSGSSTGQASSVCDGLNPDFMCAGPVPCGEGNGHGGVWMCGDATPFDERGCLRPRCSSDADCADLDGHVCFKDEVCNPDGLDCGGISGCSNNLYGHCDCDAPLSCTVQPDPDLQSGWCIPADDFPC